VPGTTTTAPRRSVGHDDDDPGLGATARDDRHDEDRHDHCHT
jgi:hypothetical protein